jgi:hypothetical protein
LSLKEVGDFRQVLADAKRKQKVRRKQKRRDKWRRENKGNKKGVRRWK